MTADQIFMLRNHIFVYHIEPFDSLGIYLGDSKEEAMESIASEIWDGVDFERLLNPSMEDRLKVLEDMGDLCPDYIRDRVLNEPLKPFNIYDAITIWTWDEYQKEQGFDVSMRLLEIIR